MNVKIFIPHIIHIENEKSFVRFVPEEERVDYNINMKVRIDSLNEMVGGISEDVEKLVFNFSNSANQNNVINGDYLRVDKDFIDNLRNSDIVEDMVSDIKLEYVDEDEIEEGVLSPASAIITSPKGQALQLQNFIGYYKEKCEFPIVLNVDMCNCHEDFELQINTWTRLTKKLQSIPDHILPPHEKIKKQPIKDFKFETINQHGTTTAGWLKDCKLIERVAINKYVIYVKSIEFIAYDNSEKK